MRRLMTLNDAGTVLAVSLAQRLEVEVDSWPCLI